MSKPDLRKKVIRGEIDVNAKENFFSKLIKGLMEDLTDAVKVRGKSVPHMIINTGDDIMYLERKGQDMSVEPKEVSNEKYIYNYIPRAVVTPGGVNLLSDQLTSPYTRGTLQFEEDGNLQEFTAEFRRMPLTMSVGVKYYLDSFTDALEVLQYIITHLNFIRTFQIVYLGQSILCSYKFPEDLQEEFNAEFDGLTQDSKYKTVEINLEIETNLPVYYPKTAIESETIISGERLWQVEWIDGEGNQQQEVLEDENEAFELARQKSGTMHRYTKEFWNSEPVLEQNKIREIKNNIDFRLS